MDLLDATIKAKFGSKNIYCDERGIDPASFNRKLETYESKKKWLSDFLSDFGLGITIVPSASKGTSEVRKGIQAIYSSLYNDMCSNGKEIICVSLKEIKQYYGNGMIWRISYIKYYITKELGLEYKYGRYSTWGSETPALCDKKGYFFSIKKSDLETVLKLK